MDGSWRCLIRSRSAARNSGVYTVFLVQVEVERTPERNEERTESWSVWRRFSEFRDLDSKLRKLVKQGHLSGPVPSPPPKKLLGSMDPTFLDERQNELEKWLSKVVEITADSRQAKALLEDFIAKHSSYPEHKPILVTKQDSFTSSSCSSSSMTEDSRSKTGSLWSSTSSATSRSHASSSASVEKDETKRVSLSDFIPLKVIGKGSFGKVVVVKRRQTSKLYAMKILEKKNIRKRKQVEHTKTERRVMELTNHPFIVDMFFAFQTKTRLFMVLEYLPGGELFFHLGKSRCFPEEWVRFWVGEIVLALEYLHGHDVVFRDLKPENILFDADGHVKLIDFGLCKDGIEELDRGTNSFCGTPEYLAPELLERKGHGKAVDFWSLGMVTYEMLTGLPPWYTTNKRKLFYRLRTAPLRFPQDVSEVACDLISRLLIRDPLARLGTGKEGFGEIKQHEFFKSIHWDKLFRKEVEPPFKPELSCTPLQYAQSCNESDSPDLDISNFDMSFTQLPLDDLNLDCDEPVDVPPARPRKCSPALHNNNNTQNSSSGSNNNGLSKSPLSANLSCSVDSMSSQGLAVKYYDNFSFTCRATSPPAFVSAPSLQSQ